MRLREIQSKAIERWIDSYNDRANYRERATRCDPLLAKPYTRTNRIPERANGKMNCRNEREHSAIRSDACISF